MPALKARCYHCAAAYSLSPGISEIVIFGGVTRYPPSTDDLIADTTVLRFGECLICLYSLYNFIHNEMKCVNYCQGRFQDFSPQ